MTTRVSTKGQIVLPGPLRRRLSLQPGDFLDIEVDGTRIVLTPRAPQRSAAAIVQDPVTGFPVLRMVGANIPKLTSQEVAEILSDFP